MKKIITNKGINTKKIQQIENFDLSLGIFINPNLRQQVVLNPIGLELNLTKLKELIEELQGFDIDIKEINCNRVFSENTDLTETEVFIRNIGNCSYMSYRNDYLKMIEQRELEEVFTIEERKARVLELEAEIKKEVLKGATVGKLNKDLRKSCEARAEELRKELHSIEETFNVVEEDYINNMLYLMATSRIDEIKNRIEEKIIYLEGVMKEI